MSKEGSIGVILEALRKKLNPWLGEPKWKLKEGRATFIYRFGSESQPIIPMHLKIEINIIHESILQSMAFTTKKVSRAEFEENMSEKLNDIAFIEIGQWEGDDENQIELYNLKSYIETKIKN